VLVCPVHPADRRAGLPDRPRRQDARTRGAAGAARGSTVPLLRPGGRRTAKHGGSAVQARRPARPWWYLGRGVRTGEGQDLELLGEGARWAPAAPARPLCPPPP